MTVGVLKERSPGERRVAVVPAHIGSLSAQGVEVLVQTGAGNEAGYGDDEYRAKGAEVLPSRDEVIRRADAILAVRAAAAAPQEALDDIGKMREGRTLIGLLEPYGGGDSFDLLRERKVTSFAMELIPRITRAQSMDVLSSMASVAGYKAALLAAEALPRLLPMMMTAAGTIVPAKIFVVGAGVAGLQAIATAHRLGALVRAYDIRPAVREQVESLGARFVALDLEAAEAETSGGYAKAMGEEFYRRQREKMLEMVAESDVVITTAAIPGKKAPVLITEEMVRAMPLGSVIVDLAAERGGNCELSEPGQSVVKHGVRIIAPVNLPATVPVSREPALFEEHHHLRSRPAEGREDHGRP